MSESWGCLTSPGLKIAVFLTARLGAKKGKKREPKLVGSLELLLSEAGMLCNQNLGVFSGRSMVLYLPLVKEIRRGGRPSNQNLGAQPPVPSHRQGG